MKNIRPPVPIPRSATRRGVQGYQGFTLIELMVTIAVASIVLGIAAPSLSTMVAGQRAKGAATDLYLSLMRARSEALKRNTSVTLQPAGDGAWQSGWTIPDPASSTQMIENHGPLQAVSISGPSSVAYRGSGRATVNGTPTSFDITASGANKHWCISIDLSGRPYQKSSSTSC